MVLKASMSAGISPWDIQSPGSPLTSSSRTRVLGTHFTLHQQCNETFIERFLYEQNRFLKSWNLFQKGRQKANIPAQQAKYISGSDSSVKEPKQDNVHSENLPALQ